jgi:hypothetical protein
LGGKISAPLCAKTINVFRRKRNLMAAGTQPALDKSVENKPETDTSDPKPLSFKDRVLRKLTEIFEYNERLGPTRQ